jgi:tetratricopeptide (TPR) repeat protein
MTTSAEHLLAGPWGLPGDLDAELGRALEQERYGTALALLRDCLPAKPAPRLWVLLAFVRFQDAREVMVTELLPACQEALGLLERAAEAGLPLEAVAPLREEVEHTLAEETVRELAAERMSAERAEGAPLEDVLEAASRLRATHPARAAELFLVAARRDVPERAPVHRTDAGIALHQAGRTAEARPYLEAALALDWRAPALWPERVHVDWAATLLLEQAHAARDDAAFDSLWARALAQGRQLQRPFPANWLNQERLLALLISRRDGNRAAQVATRIESSRDYLPKALAAQVAEARTLARQQSVLPS